MVGVDAFDVVDALVLVQVRFDDARLAISNLGNLGGRCDPGSAHEEGVDPAALCTTGARTNHTPHELYIAGEHSNVLGCQSHPEFCDELLRSRIEPALVEKRRIPNDFKYVRGCCADQGVGRRLVRHWLLRER